ncbi:hypothetical protein [Streptomyces chryseus]|uniref:Serine/threonine protein kinase n=2 Tax=Streptomyces chryseus TaxID=68186 RepID=A0ABQ3DR39_9ACTN|nr:hypothetical protein [Streptomyces chryseus]GHB04603.1 hypothetical protein GCM10010346_29630 [Streptomyces chryseus]
MDEQTGQQAGVPGAYAPPPQGFGPPPPAYAPAPQPQPPHAPSPYGAPPTPPSPYAPHPPAAAPGPDFLAADRRNAVVVDAEGVSLESNGATLDFPWRDIATVHYKPGPGGEVLMVAVALPDGRFYEGVVVARNRAKLQEWCAQLAPVLGHYLAGRGH